MNKISRKGRFLILAFIAVVLVAATAPVVYSYVCCSPWVLCPGTDLWIQCCTEDGCGELSTCDAGWNFVDCWCEGYIRVTAICPPPV